MARGAALTAEESQRLRTQLRQLDAELVIQQLNPTPVAGLFEVVVDGGVLYVSRDGQYVVRGDLARIQGTELVSLTEQTVSRQRASVLAAVPRAQAVVFPARGRAKSVITVFTDTDCGYCRQLHQEVPALNRAGVEVRYLAFPRSLPNTGLQAGTAQVMHDIWCAPARDLAMTRAKQGERVARAASTCRSPIEAQYALGRSVGVRGTPAIFNARGEQLGGYLNAAELLRRLELRP